MSYKMTNLKEKYKDIIHSWNETFEEDAESSRLVIQIRFKNQSRLEIKEKLIKEIDYLRYSYQWMEANNSLIIRWDNAPKHLDIGLHHKHIGTENKIEISQEMNINKVLTFIAKIIGIFLLISFTAIVFF